MARGRAGTGHGALRGSPGWEAHPGTPLPPTTRRRSLSPRVPKALTGRLGALRGGHEVLVVGLVVGVVPVHRGPRAQLGLGDGKLLRHAWQGQRGHSGGVTNPPVGSAGTQISTAGTGNGRDGPPGWGTAPHGMDGRTKGRVGTRGPRAVPTCGEARLLLALAQVAVGAEGALQGGGWLHGLAPALPLDEVGDAALRHGRRLRHVLLHHLRDAWGAAASAPRGPHRPPSPVSPPSLYNTWPPPAVTVQRGAGQGSDLLDGQRAPRLGQHLDSVFNIDLRGQARCHGPVCAKCQQPGGGRAPSPRVHPTTSCVCEPC